MGYQLHDSRRTRSTIVVGEERVQPAPCVVLYLTFETRKGEEASVNAPGPWQVENAGGETRLGKYPQLCEVFP